MVNLYLILSLPLVSQGRTLMKERRTSPLRGCAIVFACEPLAFRFGLAVSFGCGHHSYPASCDPDTLLVPEAIWQICGYHNPARAPSIHF